jgi:PAS domain S-box-containing protein
MTSNTSKRKVVYQPAYGDLTEINNCRLVLNSIGKDALTDIVSNYIDILGTSAAVYEKNGDYALGIFASGWCQFLDRTSRELCGTSDNRKALASGKWLCHESCWTEASKRAVETKQPVDIECCGGIRLFAVPIFVGVEVVGSMNFGYGTPPKEQEKLQKIAHKFRTNVDELIVRAKSYKPRSSTTIEICKKQLLSAAILVGLTIQSKDAEEALRASKEWFSTTLRSIGDAVIATDEKALVTLMNPVAQALTGWSEKDAIGKPLKDVFDIFNEETGKRAEVPIDRIIKEGTVVGLANHTLLIAKDGTKRSIDDSGAPIRDDKGSIIGTILVFRDVTEKRQLERDLTERVKELTCLYGIADLVEKRVITIDEICQETVNLVPHSLQYPGVACAQITIGGKEYETPNYMETEWTQSADIKVAGMKAGTLKVCYLEEKPARDEGPFLHEERMLIDAVAERLGRITERIRSEEQLKRMNRLLLAIRNINQLIVREQDAGKLLKGTCDNLVDTTSCYHSWSVLLDRAMKMTTYAQAGLGDDFSPIVGQAGAGHPPTCCQKALRQDEIVVVENPRSTCADCPLSHRCANGVGLAVCIKYSDKTYGVLCVCVPQEILSNKQELMLFGEVGEDLSLALRNLELEVEHTKTDRMKDEFISLVSHELRTPLTVVTGSLQTAMVEGISPDEARELLNNAVQGAEALEVILENMLELSRYQVGRLDIRNTSVSISDVAGSVIRKLKNLGAAQRFSTDFPGDLPSVEADPLKVERILYNLLENATKYSLEDTDIRVFARKEGEFVVTGVADQGIGISPEHFDKIFKLFERLETTSPHTRGVGLGLVVCKRLVEAQGGWIRVDSDLGRGSTFLFALPVCKTAS